MYRKNDEIVFSIFSALANVAVVVAFVLVLMYHFYDGHILYRNMALTAVMLSLFSKYQVLLLKVYVLEIRTINLMNAGRRPGKISLSMGNITILIYSTIFWLTVIGALLAFLPAGWRPDIRF